MKLCGSTTSDEKGTIMYRATQFSIPLVSNKDAVARVLGELGRSGASISAAMLTPSIGRNYLRVVFDNPEVARNVLARIGVPHGETDVICVKLASVPDGLAGVTEALAEAQVKLEYVYLGTGKGPGNSVAVLRVRDVHLAMAVLPPEWRMRAMASVA